MLTRRLRRIPTLVFLLSPLVFGLVDEASAGQSNLSVSALTLSPSSIPSGNSLTAQLSVRNIGQKATSASVTFSIVPDGQSLASASASTITQTSLGMLQPGKTIAVVSALPISIETSSGVY
jgi:hypothetical protein